MSVVRSFVRLLAERWPWWVIPLVVMVLLTLLAGWLGQETTIAPFDYGGSTR